MMISGFSFVRNGTKLGYPFVESIKSVLPICDEFVISVGKSEDDTLEQIAAISDPKIKIIETEWNENKFVRGAIIAHQTNIALKQCKGKWCFYIQADEVVHEKYLTVVKQKCEYYLVRKYVEGLLFNYIHFWGNFQKHQTARNWYRAEIRVIRNNIDIESYKDAQGFRLKNQKLKVVPAGASIYHYGWVRPSETMKKKTIVLDKLYDDKERLKKHELEQENSFDYGNLKHLMDFKGTHPAIMKEFIERTTPLIKINPNSKTKHKHDKLWIRILSWIERNILHFQIGEWKNYILITPDN